MRYGFGFHEFPFAPLVEDQDDHGKVERSSHIPPFCHNGGIK
jgi:hypothetical protein